MGGGEGLGLDQKGNESEASATGSFACCGWLVTGSLALTSRVPDDGRNSNPVALIFEVVRLLPSLSSHLSYTREPVSRMGSPLAKYWAMTSPCLPHDSMLCHSVFSCFSPCLFFQRSEVARVNLVTDVSLLFLLQGLDLFGLIA